MEELSPWVHVSGNVYSYPLFRFGENEFKNFIAIFIAYLIAHRTLLKFVFKPLSKYVIHKNDEGKTVDNAPPTKDEVLKFETTCWRFFYYAFNLIVGMFLLKDEEWAYRTDMYFVEYPQMTFPSHLRLYYVMELACYSYVSCCLFIDKKQKDFVQMLVHHITTLLLIYFSFEIGFYRIGCIILILMDISDPFLELAKSFLYCGYTKMADILFAAFTIIFFFSRNFIYPYYVMPAGTNACTSNGSPVPHRKYFVVGLYVLQALFLFWGFLIIKIVVVTYILGWEERSDIRDHDDEEKINGKKQETNGKEKGKKQETNGHAKKGDKGKKLETNGKNGHSKKD